MKRHPIHVVVAKLRRGEKLFVLDYGKYEFEDGSRPGQGVMKVLRSHGRVKEVCDGSRIGARIELAEDSEEAEAA